MLQKLQDYGEPIPSLIPFGRSLQRPFAIKVPENYDSAYERFWADASGKHARSDKIDVQAQNMLFNPFRYPRVVIALQKTEDKKFPGFLFLGYLEPTNQIEVISFNKSIGRMEFQIVSDFAEGLKPKVEYVSRNKCLRCHISGGPIFSVFAWNEGPNSARVQDLMARAMSPDGFAKPLDKDMAKYHGVPINSPNGFTIENIVTSANAQLLATVAWPKMCAASNQNRELECKRDFLRRAFDLKTSTQDFKMGQYSDEEYEQLVAPLTKPLFNNRIIFEALGINSTLDLIGKLETDHEQITILNERLGDLANHVRNMSDEFDPRQIRNNQGHRHKTTFIVAMRNAVGLHKDENFKALNEQDKLKKIATAVAAIPDDILLKRHFDLSSIRYFARTALNMPVDEIDTVKKLPNSLLHKRHYLTGALAPFERSCVRCHTGPSSFPPPFLLGKTQEEVEKNIEANKELILAYTDPKDPAMPPVRDSYTQSDLQLIRQYVTELNSDHQTFESKSCSDYKPLTGDLSLQDIDNINDERANHLLTHYCSQCHQQND
ncbi:MAG: hypothetical protein AAF203_10330, partial [Pseudomonadota bacterium]